jgi:hypothetical protein
MMMNAKFDLKEQIIGTATFVRARAGNLWYRTALGFEFPVPFTDLGEATFEAEIKGSFLMRYIRKHAALIAEARKENVE